MINLVQQQFGPVADAYASSDVHAHGDSLRLVLQLLQPEPEWHMLDVATGAGHTALTMAPHVKRVDVIDLTPAMLAKARQLAHVRGNLNLAFTLASGSRLPQPNASLDAITCRLALHHFTDAPGAIAECYRTLKTGGKLALTDNIVANDIEVASDYNRFETLRDPSHWWVRPLAHLEAMLRETGFCILQSLELTKEFEFHEWADRQRVAPEDKTVLLRMLQCASPGLRYWLSPRSDGKTTYFTLREAVIIAQKAVRGLPQACKGLTRAHRRTFKEEPNEHYGSNSQPAQHSQVH